MNSVWVISIEYWRISCCAETNMKSTGEQELPNKETDGEL